MQIKKNDNMIEQVEVEQLPIFAKNSVAEIGCVNVALDEVLKGKGYHSFFEQSDGLGEGEIFLFKLDRDYYFIHVYKESIQFSEIYTTSLKSSQHLFQSLFEALNLSFSEMEVHYENFEIQYISIQNQLNLR